MFLSLPSPLLKKIKNKIKSLKLKKANQPALLTDTQGSSVNSMDPMPSMAAQHL